MKDTEIKDNRKSLWNLLPEEKEINRGLIFYQLPHLMLTYSGWFESSSDRLLKTERLLTDNPDATSDGQFYRKFRDGSGSRDDLYNYLSKIASHDSVENAMYQSDAYANDLKSTGGWMLLDSHIQGLKRSMKYSDLHMYMDFLLSLCEQDKRLLDGTSIHLDDEMRLWLPYENFNESIDAQAHFLIALILHWAALFEHFLNIKDPELRKTPFTLNNYIPTIDQQGKVQHSVAILLERNKGAWGVTHHSKDKISWQLYYRDIAESIASKSSEPDPESIKKQFSRWRKGKLSITIKSFKKYVAILNESYDEYDPILMTIPFVQLFDNIQRELIKKGIPKEIIVKQFEKYPDYLELVSRRYNNFCEKSNET